MSDNLRKIRLDGRYVGYLTRTTRRADNGALRYHMHIMPQDVYAVALGAPEQFSYRLPEPGDSLLFVPNMIDENRGMTIGRVIGFVNRSEGEFRSQWYLSQRWRPAEAAYLLIAQP